MTGDLRQDRPPFLAVDPQVLVEQRAAGVETRGLARDRRHDPGEERVGQVDRVGPRRGLLEQVDERQLAPVAGGVLGEQPHLTHVVELPRDREKREPLARPASRQRERQRLRRAGPHARARHAVADAEHDDAGAALADVVLPRQQLQAGRPQQHGHPLLDDHRGVRAQGSGHPVRRGPHHRLAFLQPRLGRAARRPGEVGLGGEAAAQGREGAAALEPPLGEHHRALPLDELQLDRAQASRRFREVGRDRRGGPDRLVVARDHDLGRRSPAQRARERKPHDDEHDNDENQAAATARTLSRERYGHVVISPRRAASLRIARRSERAMDRRGLHAKTSAAASPSGTSRPRLAGANFASNSLTASLCTTNVSIFRRT